MMKIIFYGRLAEEIGRELDEPAFDGRSIADVRQQLAAAFPTAAETLLSKRSRAAVGNTLVPENRPVSPEDTIEFLPPVSGG